jgi:hypothetical protein
MHGSRWRGLRRSLGWYYAESRVVGTRHHSKSVPDPTRGIRTPLSTAPAVRRGRGGIPTTGSRVPAAGPAGGSSARCVAAPRPWVGCVARAVGRSGRGAIAARCPDARPGEDVPAHVWAEGAAAPRAVLDHSGRTAPAVKRAAAAGRRVDAVVPGSPRPCLNRSSAAVAATRTRCSPRGRQVAAARPITMAQHRLVISMFRSSLPHAARPASRRRSDQYG